MSGLAATFSASLACGLQLSVTLGDDGEVPPGSAVGGVTLLLARKEILSSGVDESSLLA